MDELESFLDQIGLEVVGESETDLIAYCPFHSNRNSPAFNISKINPHMWRCWNSSCGESGTLPRLVQNVMGVSALKALRMIHKNGPEKSNLSRILKVEDEDEPYSIWPEEMLDKIKVNDVDEIQPYLEYINHPGFTRETLHEFEVGFSIKRKRIVIPVRDEEDNLVGFSGRSIYNDGEKQKYFDPGVPKRYILFNLNRAKKYSTVIVVEGPFDVMKVWQAGFSNCVAIMGGGFTKQQQKKLTQYFREAIIFLDDDDAGRSLANKVQEAMRKVGKEVAFAKYPPNKNDPAEMSEEEIREVIKSRESLLQRKLRELGIKEDIN